MEPIEMANFECVASLRPQPYGLPLRGRAPRSYAFKTRRHEWLMVTLKKEIKAGTIHLIFTASWFKIGVRCKCPHLTAAGVAIATG